MKQSQKRRLESLAKVLNKNHNRKGYARVLYDASSDFDPSTLQLDAEVALIFPDNGKRVISEVDYSNQPYKIFYE